MAMLSALIPAVAAAQRVAGPFEGVLGGNKDAPQTLDFRGSLSAVWDDQLSGVGTVDDDRYLQDGAGLGGSVGLSHSKNAEGLRWQSSVDSGFRLYGTGSDEMAATFSGSTGIDTNLNARTSLGASLSAGYSPFYDYAPNVGAPSSISGFDDPFRFATVAARNISLSETVGLSTRISRRDTVTGSVGAQQYVFFEESSASTSSWSLQAQYSRELTRTMGVHAGVSHWVGHYEYDDQPTATTNSIDAGIHYGDTLQFSRRTAVSFSTSTSVVSWEGETDFRINATVDLTRAISRTGSVGVSYVRDVSFVAGFRGPLMSDTVSTNFGTQLGRNASWSAQAALSRGSIGFGDAGYGDYHSASAGVSVTRALNRRIGVNASYSYYRYGVPSGSTVITSLSRFSRQSVSGGLTLWVPLIGNEASR